MNTNLHPWASRCGALLPALLGLAVLSGAIGSLRKDGLDPRLSATALLLAWHVPPTPDADPADGSRFDAGVWLEQTARSIMRDKAAPLVKKHDDGIDRNLDSLADRIGQATRQLDPYMRDVIQVRADTFILERREAGSRLPAAAGLADRLIGPNPDREGERKLKRFRDAVDQDYQSHLTSQKAIDNTLRAALLKLQESYLRGIELQVKRLTDPLDAPAADHLRAEITAVQRDPRRFESLMRGLPDDPDSPPVPGVALLPLETPAVAAGSIQLLYKCMETNPDANHIKPHLRLVNTTDDPVPLGELTIRYWFTNDGRNPLKHWCDYSSAGNSNVKGTFTKVSKRPGADCYLEIGFSAGAGVLAKGTDVDIQSRSAKDDWSAFDQADDYSFDPARTDYAASPKVTLYQKGTLIFGTEP